MCPETSEAKEPASSQGEESRREFLTTVSTTAAMSAGLVAGYGAFGAIAGRFLYPNSGNKGWMLIAPVAEIEEDSALRYQTPAGATVVIARRGTSGSEADFVALSSVCPHLGCQVHWEPHNNRFFCPCHNGVFNPEGKAIEGPPAQAGQSLPTFPLKVDRGLLFIEVDLGQVVEGPGEIIDLDDEPCGPGHDPCLSRITRA